VHTRALRVRRRAAAHRASCEKGATELPCLSSGDSQWNLLFANPNLHDGLVFRPHLHCEEDRGRFVVSLTFPNPTKKAPPQVGPE
jgi:hypothetical protein